jgi:DNA replication protein DnaD
MAEKTIDELNSELATVTEQTRDSYDVLYTDRAGKRGLYKRLSIAENNLKKKGLLPGAKEKLQAEIDALKPQIEAAEIEYNRYQSQKNTLNKELKDLKKSEQDQKTKKATAKGAGNLYQKALDNLRTAELGLSGYKGTDKYYDAWRKAEAAYANAVEAGLTPIALGNPRVTVPPLVVDSEQEVDVSGKKESENISAFISTLADPKNSKILEEVQRDLAKNFGYKGPIDGQYSLPLQNAINTIVTSRSSLPATLQGSDLRTFIADDKSSQLLGISASGAAGGSGGTSIANYIADATQAASIVNTVMQRELKRDATPKELADLSKILIDAQKKNPYKTTNGIRTGGVNEDQVITGVIQSGKYAGDKKLGKLSTLGKLATEFTTKKNDKRTILSEDIMETANANGVTLTPFQLQNYAQQVQDGTDIGIIKRNIRSSAALGMPANIQKLIAEGTDLETIYSPYRKSMAAILEIPAESIDINDSTLRMAIGPEREMSLYDFQRQLRKDTRWQYTDNARKEVSDSALKVLKDFGFQG